MPAIDTSRPDHAVPIDGALALVVAAFTLAEALDAGQSSAISIATLVVACSVPIAIRNIYPVVAVVLAMVGVTAASGLDSTSAEAFAPLIAPLLVAYTVGARAGLAGMFVAIASAVAGAMVVARATDSPEDILIYVVLFTGALAVGRAGREIEYEGDAMRREARRLAADRDLRAREAVALERLRIARELHDVIGHSISVMGVQAGAVRRRLAPELTTERDALLAVEETGRSAVLELRQMLGLLRTTDVAEASLDVPATARRLEDLATDGKRAGLDVTLVGSHLVDDLPPAVAFTVVRIVQESMTNVLKHAPGASVEIELARSGSELVVTVRDDGAGRAPVEAGAGFGLVGIQERVAVFDGSLHAGPRSPHGFEVVAMLRVVGA